MNMLSQISGQVKDRLKSPLVLFFAAGWIHTNYDLVLYITSLELGADAKIDLIKKYDMLSTNNMFLFPLGTALLLYFSWYLLDALSKGLMEKHPVFVSVISAHIQSFFYKMDTPKNKLVRMNETIDQLNYNLESARMQKEDYERRLIKIIENLAFNLSTGYELTNIERNIINRSAERYLIIKNNKPDRNDHEIKELDKKLTKLNAKLIPNYGVDSKTMAIDLHSQLDADAKPIVAAIKFFEFELIDRISTLNLFEAK